MGGFLRGGFTSNSKPISFMISYIVLGSYLQLYGSAKNVKIPALLVFGDSIVDPGNNNYIRTIGRANFPPYGRDFPGGIATGRYSNGKVPSDLIAEELGIKDLVPPYLDPSLQVNDLLTGVSFASGASGFDPSSSKIANALSLEAQLKLFKKYINKLNATVGENATTTIISQSVYLIVAGSNDITNTYFLLPMRRLKYDFPTYANLLVNWASIFIQELYALGARRFAVTNAPPCGCLPSQRTIDGGVLRKCAAKENEAAAVYNMKLQSGLISLNQKLPESKIALLDIYTPLLNLIANPSRYGFEVANRGCCGTGNLEVSFLCTKLDIGTCTNASNYVFWDSFHPTEATYRFLVRDATSKQDFKDLSH